MAKTTSTEVTSTGICKFCKEEFDKGKMTQHLKSCKQRIADQQAEKSAESQETRLFHLLVEGRYLPQYWMHLEIPADLTLLDLDDFLRGIWLECCDHLSEFKIGKKSYMSQAEDWLGFGLGGPTEELVEDEEEADEEVWLEEDEEEVDEEVVLEVNVEGPELSNSPPAETQPLSAVEIAMRLDDMLHEEFMSNGSDMSSDEFTAQLMNFFETRLGTVLPPQIQSQFRLMAPFLQAGLIADVEDEEQDMDIELGKALKGGQKFYHEYDFGSTTELARKVVAERTGVVKEDDDEVAIEIMARNNPPVIPCSVCGKPSTQVVSGYLYAEDGALCETHAKSGEYGEDMLLPVVNSPRVGVCGYTGDAELEEADWDDDDDEDDDEEEDEE